MSAVRGEKGSGIARAKALAARNAKRSVTTTLDTRGTDAVQLYCRYLIPRSYRWLRDNEQHCNSGRTHT